MSAKHREVKIKTEELIGVALDWAVAKAEGHNVGVKTKEEQRAQFLDGADPKHWEELIRIADTFTAKLCIVRDDGYKSTMPAEFMVPHMSGPQRIEYSKSWLQAGPIIEREGIELNKLPDNGRRAVLRFVPGRQDVIMDTWRKDAPWLVVAMRCYVASKMGDEVDVPEELL